MLIVQPVVDNKNLNLGQTLNNHNSMDIYLEADCTWKVLYADEVEYWLVDLPVNRTFTEDKEGTIPTWGKTI